MLTLWIGLSQPIRSVRGEIAGRPLTFRSQESVAWSLVGFRSNASLGLLQVSVTAGGETGQLAHASGEVEVVSGDFSVEQIRVIPGQGALLTPEVLSQEWNQLLILASTVTPEQRWEGTFLLPAQGQVSSLYGTRRSYNGGPPGSPHEGLDLAADAGAPVVAANHGMVVLAREWKVRGNAVIIDHGMGVFSGYYHLSELAVAEGQPVTKGQLIGKVGQSGLATGPHLHWEMVLQGAHTSPLEWTQRTFPEMPPAPGGAPGRAP